MRFIDFIHVSCGYSYLCEMLKFMFSVRFYLKKFFGLFMYSTKTVLTHSLSDLGYSASPSFPGSNRQ